MLFVGVSGPSSSGKTTVATALHQLFKNSILIHLDDFYFPDDQIPIDPVKKVENWDCPAAVNFAKFKKYILNLKQKGELEETPTYEGEVDLKLTKEEVAHFEDLISKRKLPQIVIVEGFMLYHDPEIVELFDIKLLFYAPFKTLKDRREARQGYNTVAGFWVDPPNYFLDIVWPEFEKNHQYLFEQGDFTLGLNDYAKNTLKLSSYENDVGTKLSTMIEWAIETIENL